MIKVTAPDIRRYMNSVSFPVHALSLAVILAIIGYGSGQIIPIYMKNYELEQATRKAVQIAVLNWRSEEDVQEAVYEKAQELGVPVERDAINIQATVRQAGPASVSEMADPSAQPTARASVNVDVAYAVPVDFPGCTFRLKMHFHIDDDMI